MINTTWYNSTFCTPENTIILDDLDEAERWLYSGVQTLVITVLFPVVASIGMAANACFMISIICHRHMRNSLNAYLCNLAVTDFMFLASTMGWYLAFYYHSEVISTVNLPVRSLADCVGIVFSTHQWYYVSLGFITLISLERYFAICKPLKHMAMRGRQRTAKLCTGVWLVSLILTAPYIPRYVYSMKCVVWPETHAFHGLPIHLHQCIAFNDNASLVYLAEPIPFVIALFINVFFYARIMKKIATRHQSLRRTSSARGGGARSTQIHQIHALRNQVARTLMINGIVFFCCQIPLRVVSLHVLMEHTLDIKLFTDDHLALVRSFCRICLYLNSCVNPLVYTFTSRHYRLAMRGALLMLTPCRLRRRLRDRNNTVITFTSKSRGSAGSGRSSQHFGSRTHRRNSH